jgi:hypothetical protein
MQWKGLSLSLLICSSYLLISLWFVCIVFACFACLFCWGISENQIQRNKNSKENRKTKPITKDTHKV